ncbi:MAG TPA: site-specific integrase [Vicinamibacterales bacterium]
MNSTRNDASAVGDRPAPELADAIALIAQQGAALVQMQQALQLLAERRDDAPRSARGAGDRITVAQLVVKAKASMTTNTFRTYAGYMTFLAAGDPSLTDVDGHQWAGIGTMWADEVLPSHLEQALLFVDQRAARRAEVRAEQREAAERTVRRTDGKGARYNAIGAWRRLFEEGIRDRHLAEGHNPAAKLKKPKRSKGGRRMALEDKHFVQMRELLSSTGDDPELDEMIVRFLVVTGARQEGLLKLRLEDIDESECTVRLREKFDTDIDQPVPDWFISMLLAFAHRRGVVARGDRVFCKRLGAGQFRPITRRRFNYVFCDRLQASYDWADDMQVTAHTLRHHATTKVERLAGSAVATAFARHALVETNNIYTEASRREVAQAVVDLHGGDHPWLHRQPRPRR